MFLLDFVLSYMGIFLAKNIEIKGYCEESFESVKEVFAENFRTGLDVGASLALAIDGKFVIDIWAGYRDKAQTQPWEQNTIVNVYSTTKVMAALCVLMLVDRGKIDLDAPVANYWPEFAQSGKENLLVRYLLSHTSGLPGFDTPIKAEDLYDWNYIVSLLAAQKPWWEPGTRSGYHMVSFGYLLGELVRRVSGTSLGRFFREEVAIPLKADFHIGFSEELDFRVAELIPPNIPESVNSAENDPESIAIRIASNPIIPVTNALTREWRAAEIPASNGHGNARAIVSITSALACGGGINGVKLLSRKTIDKAIEEQSYSTDLLFNAPTRWGLGWSLVSKENPISPNTHAFSWGGFGGSHVTIDLDAKLSWGFAMNNMIFSLTGDPRTMKLRKAIIDTFYN